MRAATFQEIKGEDAIEFDASWYQGDDIKALAHDLVEQYGDSLLEKTPEERFAIIEGYGLPTNIARMGATSSVTRSTTTYGSVSLLCTRAATSRRPSTC